MDKVSLQLIENEIERLSKRSNNSRTGLDLDDVKKLETLIKTRQLLLGEPTDISKELGNDLSEAQILKALKSEAPKANGKKKERSSKPKPKRVPKSSLE